MAEASAAVSSNRVPAVSRATSTLVLTASSGVRFMNRGSLRSSFGLIRPWRRSLVFDMIDVRLATRTGWRMAIVWAIIPPIDAPTTWARSTSRWSSRPAASSAMSASVYADFAKRGATRPTIICRFVGAGASTFVDRPMSRLSKRMTRKPRSASASTKPSGQPMSWPPSPITRRRGSASGAPWISYSRVMPFPDAAAIRELYGDKSATASRYWRMRSR